MELWRRLYMAHSAGCLGLAAGHLSERRLRHRNSRRACSGRRWCRNGNLSRALGLIGLIARVGASATVFGHLVVNEDGPMRTASVPAGCLAAAVEPVGGTAVFGRASLCVAETM